MKEAIKPIHIGFLAYPDVSLLDIAGPAQVLSAVPGAHIHLIWKTREPLTTDAGFSLLPTTSMNVCPALDVICAPGGLGQFQLMEDNEVLSFLRDQGEQARYVSSVCTGSLMLGAAGLLEGYQATCHWGFLDALTAFGAKPVARRTVRDRNRISGGGVTAGIDFGLVMAAELAGKEAAQKIQLMLEYDPQPPFNAGSPETAPPEIVKHLRELFAEAMNA